MIHSTQVVNRTFKFESQQGAPRDEFRDERTLEWIGCMNDRGMSYQIDPATTSACLQVLYSVEEFINMLDMMGARHTCVEEFGMDPVKEIPRLDWNDSSNYYMVKDC